MSGFRGAATVRAIFSEWYNVDLTDEDAAAIYNSDGETSNRIWDSAADSFEMVQGKEGTEPSWQQMHNLQKGRYTDKLVKAAIDSALDMRKDHPFDPKNYQDKTTGGFSRTDPKNAATGDLSKTGRKRPTGSIARALYEAYEGRNEPPPEFGTYTPNEGTAAAFEYLRGKTFPDGSTNVGSVPGQQRGIDPATGKPLPSDASVPLAGARITPDGGMQQGRGITKNAGGGTIANVFESDKVSGDVQTTGAQPVETAKAILRAQYDVAGSALVKPPAQLEKVTDNMFETWSYIPDSNADGLGSRNPLKRLNRQAEVIRFAPSDLTTPGSFDVAVHHDMPHAPLLTSGSAMGDVGGDVIGMAINHFIVDERKRASATTERGIATRANPVYGAAMSAASAKDIREAARARTGFTSIYGPKRKTRNYVSRSALPVGGGSNRPREAFAKDHISRTTRW